MKVRCHRKLTVKNHTRRFVNGKTMLVCNNRIMFLDGAISFYPAYMFRSNGNITVPNVVGRKNKKIKLSFLKNKRPLAEWPAEKLPVNDQ